MVHNPTGLPGEDYSAEPARLPSCPLWVDHTTDANASKKQVKKLVEKKRKLKKCELFRFISERNQQSAVKLECQRREQQKSMSVFLCI